NLGPKSVAAKPFGLALHVGEVLYGNIGGGSRLDFTVIGSAVNLASRLGRLASTLGRSIVMSSAFRDVCLEDLTPLGAHRLRGIAEEQLAYGLWDELAPLLRSSGGAGDLMGLA